MAETAKKERATSFYSIVDGDIRRRLENPEEGSVERKLTKGANEGKTVHEKIVGSIQGWIHAIKKRDSDFGPQLVITLKDSEGFYQLETDFESGYAQSFLNRFKNINLIKPIDLRAMAIKKESDPTKKNFYLIPYHQDVTQKRQKKKRKKKKKNLKLKQKKPRKRPASACALKRKRQNRTKKKRKKKNILNRLTV